MSEDLPFIDRHCIDVHASRERTWTALGELLTGASRRTGTGLFARVLGTKYREVVGAPLEPRSTIVGFRVAESQPGKRVLLEGEHRFSRYQLTFELEEQRLCAFTHAVFPGPHGAAYRAVLLGARAHVLATKRLLQMIKDRAEATP